MQSRRGYAATGNVILDMPDSDIAQPQFAHPFRSFGGAIDGAGRRVGLKPDTTTVERSNATLLRERTDGRHSRCSTSLPPRHLQRPEPQPVLLLSRLARLGNLVTTRSNVYAVWITVGYFEVSPASTVAGVPRTMTPAQTGHLSRRLYWPGVGLGYGRDRTASGLLYLRPHHCPSASNADRT